MNIGYDYCLICVVIGEASSGKTSFVNRLCRNNFKESYEPTIGVEFNTVTTKYKDYIVKLQLWDTAGDRCFAPIMKTYYKNVVGIFLVIDLTTRKSITTLDKKLVNYHASFLSIIFLFAMCSILFNSC